MSHHNLIILADVLRGFSFFEFLLVVAQVFYILVHYFKVIRVERDMGIPKVGLLPAHVVILGTVTILALASCAGQNLQRLGETPNYFAFTNPIIFAMTLWGLSFVMRFEHQRYAHTKDQHVDLIED